MNCFELLNKIALENGVSSLYFVQKGDSLCEANGVYIYTNRSFIIGGSEIIIGIYEDEYLMLASFFQELGHIINAKDVLNSEVDAWIKGFELAAFHGFVFENYVYMWAFEQLKTYAN